MECKEKLMTYLQSAKVPFEMQQHRPAFTAQEVAQSEHVPGDLVAKVVVVWADGRLVMLVLPAPYRVDLEQARQALQAEHVRLADEGEVALAFPDCEVGAMPPFGNLYDMPVIVDPALAKDPTIVMNAGTHRDTLSLRYEDFARIVQPRTEQFAYHV